MTDRTVATAGTLHSPRGLLMEDGLADPELVDALERIVVAGVAMTNAALASARPDMEITFPQWRVLIILGDRPDGLSVQQIARSIGVTLPATSRQLRRLASRGLVSLEPDARDRRVTRVRLTPAGAAARTAILADRRARIESSLSGLDTSPTLSRELSRVAAVVAGTSTGQA